jgi:hypothetical protein
MYERLMGIVTLKAPVYKEVAEDPSATQTAAIIVVITAAIGGFTVKIFDGQGGVFLVAALVSAVFSVIFQLLNWGVSAWILAKVAGMFGGKTDTNEMLRVTGFTQIFTLVNLVSLLAGISVALACVASPLYIIGFVLVIIGNVIGVREAGEFSTGNAIITSIIAGIASSILLGIGRYIVNLMF